MKAEIDGALRRVIESGLYMGGQETKAFESEWAAYCGAAHCVAVGSGTAALAVDGSVLGVTTGQAGLAGAVGCLP